MFVWYIGTCNRITSGAKTANFVTTCSKKLNHEILYHQPRVNGVFNLFSG